MSDQSEWVMVPREPTQEMIKAAEQQWLVGGTNDMARREWHAMLAAAPPAPAAEPVAVPEGWILVPEHPTDTQVLKLMNVGLRHAEYKKGTGGPTVDEMRQGMAYALQAGPEPPAPPPVEASPLPGVRVVSNPAIPPGEAYIVNGDEMHRVEASQQQDDYLDALDELWKAHGNDSPLYKRFVAFVDRVQPVRQQQTADDCTWEHAANEWADVATNAVTVLENVRDGITSFEDAIASFKSWYESARAAQPGTEKQAEPASGEGETVYHCDYCGSSFTDKVICCHARQEYLAEHDEKWRSVPVGEVGWLEAEAARLTAERDASERALYAMRNDCLAMERREDKLIAELSAAKAVLGDLKVRMCFIGHPGEAMWNSGTEDAPHWIPDWRFQAQSIEAVLHGTEVTADPLPKDTRRRDEVEAAAKAEAEALRKDAERYRWLRDDAIHFGYDDGRPSPYVVIGTCPEDTLPHYGEDLDALVDAAIAAQQGEKP